MPSKTSDYSSTMSLDQLQSIQSTVKASGPVTRSRTIRFRESIERALENELVIGVICSFVDSLSDIQSLRLVSHSFQREATKRLRLVHSPIELNSVKVVKSFLYLLNRRQSLQLTPFPFTSFDIDLDICAWFGLRALEQIVEGAGHHARMYKLTQDHNSSTCAADIRRFVGVLLASSPRLTELRISSKKVIQMSPQELKQIPARFPKLSIIDVNPGSVDKEKESREDHVPVLDILLSRVGPLKSFRIPPGRDREGLNPDMRIVRLLVQGNHRRNVLEKLMVFPDRFAIVQELMSTKLNLCDLTLLLSHGNISNREGQTADPNSVENMMRFVTAWLAIQVNSLSNLHLMILNVFHVNPDFQMPTFRLPALVVLEDLVISFLLRNTDHILNAPPVLPLNALQVPALKRLTLKHYKNQYEFIAANPIPSVHTLRLETFLTSLTDPWNFSFPNLTRLTIVIAERIVENSRPNVTFMLTRLTRLEHLSISWKGGSIAELSQLDFWDILTGGAPVPSNESTYPFLQEVDHEWDAGPLEEPVDGVFQTPSLRNMRALKTLSLEVRTRPNLNAILFMTRKGLLVPLENLVLEKIESTLGLVVEYGFMKVYRVMMLEVHDTVEIS